MHVRAANDPALLRDGRLPATRERTLLITSMYDNRDLVRNFGNEAYSYRIVYRAFASLLQRWGRVIELENAAAPAAAEELAALCRTSGSTVHLSFLPPQLMPLTEQVPQVALISWEYPNIPNEDLEGDPRQNWSKIAEKLALVIAHTDFARQAFANTGVRTPVHFVPVPGQPRYFAVPDWDPGRRVAIDCPCYVFRQPDELPRHAPPPQPLRKTLGRASRQLYMATVKPLLPGPLQTRIHTLVRASKRVYREQALGNVTLPTPVPRMDLSGVVYTSLFNPYDCRKNWQDMLSGFLLGLGEQEDATLVIKLITSPARATLAAQEIYAYYRKMCLRHRCRVVLSTAYLSDAQMLDLVRSSTFYLNTSHCEGSCMPLQDYMAAGRPPIAPPHTGIADSMVGDVGLPIDSSPEPQFWPQDNEQRTRTTWQRLNWQSLVDQLRRGYELAKSRSPVYAQMSQRGRAHIESLCSAERVWPRLAAALDSVARVPHGRAAVSLSA